MPSYFRPNRLLTPAKYEPESDSEDEESEFSDEGESSPEEDGDEEEYEGGSSSGQKRRSLGDGESSRKRRRLQVSNRLVYGPESPPLTSYSVTRPGRGGSSVSSTICA